MNKNIPRDVLELIILKLKNHICPIYTNNDFMRDKKTFLNYYNYHTDFIVKKEHYENITFQISYDEFGLTQDEFNKYSKFVKYTKKKYCNRVLDPQDFRFNILKNYNNCVGNWLSSIIYKYSNIYVPIWFCYMILPLPEIMKKNEFIFIGEIWNFINKNNIKITDKIITFIKNNRQNINFENAYINEFESYEYKKNKILSFFDTKTSIYKHINNIELNKFNIQYIINAQKIKENITAIEWCDNIIIYKLIDLIFNDNEIEENNKLLNNISLQNIKKKTKNYNLESTLESIIMKYDEYGEDFEDKEDEDGEYYENYDVEDEEYDKYRLKYINYKIDKWISLNELKKHYKKYSMTILDEEPYKKSLINYIKDDLSNFTIKDLQNLIKDLPNSFNIDDAEKLRLYFDRYKVLYNSLNKRGLTIRTDSKLYIGYVKYGKYMGPRIEYPNFQQYTDFDFIAEMMKEMEFFYQKTQYRVFADKMNKVKCFNSEKAKYISLYFIAKYKPDNDLKIPDRFKDFMKDNNKLNEIYEYWLYIANLPEVNSFNQSDDSDSDCGNSFNM